MKREVIIHAIILSLLVISAFLIYSTSPYKPPSYKVTIGRVVKTSDDIDYNAPIKIGCQRVWVETGGKTYEFDNVLRGNWMLDEYFYTGEPVILLMSKNNILYAASTKVFTEVTYIALFLLAIVVVGGKLGIRTVLSLTYTTILLFFILYPAILRGADPLISSVLTAIVITFLTMFSVAGINEKALAATLSSLLGIVTAVVLGYTGIVAMNLNPGGFSEFAQMLFFSGHFVDLSKLFCGVIVLASLGAIMDVSIDIASGLYELSKNARVDRETLFRSGMNIGRDIIGTMASTLVLVYAGAMAAAVLFFMAKRSPVEVIMDYNFIACEILLAMSGSIALTLTIPFTAFVCSRLYA